MADVVAISGCLISDFPKIACKSQLRDRLTMLPSGRRYLCLWTSRRSSHMITRSLHAGHSVTDPTIAGSLAVLPVLRTIVDLLRRSPPSGIPLVISQRYATTLQPEDPDLTRNSKKAERKEWVTGDLLELDDPQPEVRQLNDSARNPSRSTSITEKMLDEKDDVFDPLDVHRPKPSTHFLQFGDSDRRRKKAGPKDDLRGGDVVFGTNPVLLALRQQRRQIYRLFITEAKSLSQDPEIQEIRRICKERNIPIVQMQSAHLMRLSENRPHQGLCLDCTPYLTEEIDLSSLTKDTSYETQSGKQLWLFLDSVMDPMNLGAILRSGYFFGVDKFLLFNSCPLTSTVSKASAGVMEIAQINLINPKGIKSFFAALKDQKWSITATCSKNELIQFGSAAKKGLESVEVRGNTVLVIGNEHSGVNSDIIPFCDQVISVEPGNNQAVDQANCLNVSVAAGVILSQIAMKRKQRQLLNLKE